MRYITMGLVHTIDEEDYRFAYLSFDQRDRLREISKDRGHLTIHRYL